jgi:hypothetical protein
VSGPSFERIRNAQIARGLCDAIASEAETRAARGDFDGWDGHEVREWLAAQFERERTTLMREAKRRGLSRWRAFGKKVASFERVPS